MTLSAQPHLPLQVDINGYRISLFGLYALINKSL